MSRGPRRNAPVTWRGIVKVQKSLFSTHRPAGSEVLILSQDHSIHYVGLMDTHIAPWFTREGHEDKFFAEAEATYVLVAVPNYGINIATMTRDPNILGPNGAFWFIRGEADRCHPTKWMPLPPVVEAPPRETK